MSVRIPVSQYNPNLHEIVSGPHSDDSQCELIAPGGNCINAAAKANWNNSENLLDPETFAYGNVTTVGTNGGPSAYGTYDQSGNVYEWNDLTGGTTERRGIRGGYWGAPISTTTFNFSNSFSPFISSIGIGFRIATLLNPLALPNFVSVGDPGFFTGVSYIYQINKYIVTNLEYVDFLNAKASSDTYGLYNPTFENEIRYGIIRSGTPGNYSYSVKFNMENKPVIFVTWFNCARYCNWLHNGKGDGDTETGAYTLNGAMSGYAPGKNASANYYIPTNNEWGKAGYYRGGGEDAGFWTYATQSDDSPTPVLANSNGDGIGCGRVITKVKKAGSIYVYDNAIVDWERKKQDWKLVEKVTADTNNLGNMNERFGRTTYLSQSNRNDSNYVIVMGCPTASGDIDNVGAVYTKDIVLRKRPPSLQNPETWIDAKVFGYTDQLNELTVGLSFSNNLDNQKRYLASGVIRANENGDIFVEVSGQDPATKGFIEHRPYIKSIIGQYVYGNLNETGMVLYAAGKNTPEFENLNLVINAENSAYVYNTLGLFNKVIIGSGSPDPSGCNLFTMSSSGTLESLNLIVSSGDYSFNHMNLYTRGK
jgi:formylglycine-generating enzyme required for sulfatase activity